jgi:hypothetical protein
LTDTSRTTVARGVNGEILDLTNSIKAVGHVPLQE